ncbi:hypothetical protein [Dyadobacter sp. CY351]|uniref:hypothetical protein n=1 Tax=Dyadobacter sp. CY351 TaxID=2909337 RepID=UPI001F3FE612|nr:hypothetical protein [Dyadobacter sp. CY351]MCF2518343.1 hypothetical protein [Dyadobacter sp. CY351]
MSLTNAVGGLPIAKPESWLKAFEMLKQLLHPLVMKDRTMVFFDEFPWIDTPRSGFLNSFHVTLSG